MGDPPALLRVSDGFDAVGGLLLDQRDSLLGLLDEGHIRNGCDFFHNHSTGRLVNSIQDIVHYAGLFVFGRHLALQSFEFVLARRLQQSAGWTLDHILLGNGLDFVHYVALFVASLGKLRYFVAIC